MSADVAIADFKKTGIRSVVLMQDGAGYDHPTQAMVFHGGCD